MERTIDVSETGSYGIQDNDVNVDGVWSNEETGRQSFGGRMEVGYQVASTALGSAQEAAGGLKTTDMGVEAQVSRRESRRAPRGFDDPEMDADAFTLATEERIRGEAEADRRSDALAERYQGLVEEADEEGAELRSRAERCRAEVTSETHYQRTTPDETPDVDQPPAEPWTDLSQDELAEVNKSAARLADALGDETAMGRGTLSKLLAQRVLNGANPKTAVLNLKADIERRMPEVKQPIADIDPFNQYQTTVEGSIDVLWQPTGDGQRQVGLISDDSGEQIKITIWQRAGDKPTLREGDRVRVIRGKVNAYQRQGEWETSIAIDADAEIQHLERGDGPARQRKMQSDEATIPPWDADSDTHAWLTQRDVETVDLDETDISERKLDAINEWVRGNITEGEIETYAARDE